MALTPTKQFRVLLADDHDLVCQGLRVLIEREPGWKVCGTAETGPKAVEAARRLGPDIAVVDLEMPGFDGLEVTRQIKRHLPACEVLIFTGSYQSDSLIREVFASGAKSYILKTEASQFMMDALKSLAENKPFFTDITSAVIFARFNQTQSEREQHEPTSNERLSVAEQELVKLLADGHSNATVASKQHLSVRTVENMRADIMRKLQLTSFAGLVRYAVRNDIIKV